MGKGFLGKFLNVLSGKPGSSEEKPAQNVSPFAPPRDKIIDVEFAENFTSSGGKFIFCESVDDAVLTLDRIAREAQLDVFFCPDNNLQSLLGKAGLRNFDENPKKTDAFCTYCEYLVAYNGGIMVDANQTREKKLHELPDVLIIFAYTDQLVAKLNDGLAGIRERYKGNIPSQITTLHGPEKSGLADPGSITAKKDIYLLYIENQ